MTDRPTEVVIVTGNNGLIGKALIDALRSTYQFVGFDRDGNPQPPHEVECVCVDVTDDASVKLGVDRTLYAYGDRIASVVHLAAYYDFSGEESDLYEEVTVRGTERLLRALRTEGAQVEQFIFSSTMLVHAPTRPGRRITEESPLDPAWSYPESKARTEEVIRAERGNIPVVLARIAGVYTDFCDSIPIAHQIQRIRERRLTSGVFPGDISHGQAFVHLDDVVDALDRMIRRRRELPPEVALLIGEPRTYSYDQIQRELGELLHHESDWVTREIPKELARTGAWIQGKIPGLEDPFIKPWMIDRADDHFELDISKAERLLGWRPKRRLLETLPLMVEHLKADPEAWYRRHNLTEASLIERALT